MLHYLYSLLLIEFVHEDITFKPLSILKSIIPGIQVFDEIPEIQVYYKDEDLYTK